MLACSGAVLAGCGEKEEITSGPAPAPAESRPAPADTATTPQPDETKTDAASPDAPSRSPEDQQGGAGDEIPARSQALFTGRRGRITPRVVRVPPFIAVRVELRSGDGARYRLTGRGKTLRAGGRLSSMGVTFDGLRTGRRLTLRGTGGRVAVEASAEPGP